MPRIVLVRHGRPAGDYTSPIPGYSFGAWRDACDAAPLGPVPAPSPALEQLVRTSLVIAASSLHRSIASARRLAPEAVPLIEPLFRELELPTAIKSGIRLWPKLWSALARIAWYCGWSPGVESVAGARRRATLAAALLTELAATRGPVLLAGHGLMNSLIARRLRRSGWQGPLIPSRRNWEFGVYERTQP